MVSVDDVPIRRPLGDLLAERRRRRFVGRTAELELVRSALESSAPQFSVLHVYGPGGIGKSTLLDAVSDVAASIGATVVRLDGRDLASVPAAVIAALRTSLDVPDDGTAITGPGRVVILLDTYERVTALDGWLRTHLVPRLPSTALTVLAGRSPPSPAWRADPGWGDLLRVVSLRNLSPTESLEYLRTVAVPEARHEHIVQVSHGHPLGLALLADVAARDGELMVDPLPPNLVASLLASFVDSVPSDLHRRALEVCALTRVTTEALLRDALDVDDAHALFDWLRSLSFVNANGEGLCPHDLARDIVDADLRWRDRERYKEVFRRVQRHILGLLLRATGHEQQRAIVDLKFVFRNLPDVLSPVDWESWGVSYPVRASSTDRRAIVDLVEAAEGAASAVIAARWFDRQPEGFHVLRDHDGSVRGVIAIIDLTAASAEDKAADPGARAAWNFAQQRSPLRSGEVITQTRFVIDRRAYQDPSPTVNAVPVVTLQRNVCTAGLSWDFLTMADPDRWNDYFAIADLPRAEGADFEVGGTRFGLFAHDFRQLPVAAWLDLVTERALTRDVIPEPPTTSPQLLVLSQAEFAGATKQALRDLHHPASLACNPLVRTRLLQDYGDGAEPDGEALERVLRDAIDALADDPRDGKVLRAVDRTYLRPAGTQESAAAMLNLPFSTYRRHLTQGVARIAGWLWEREVYGFGEHK